MFHLLKTCFLDLKFLSEDNYILRNISFNDFENKNVSILLFANTFLPFYKLIIWNSVYSDDYESYISLKYNMKKSVLNHTYLLNIRDAELDTILNIRELAVAILTISYFLLSATLLILCLGFRILMIFLNIAGKIHAYICVFKTISVSN